MASLRPEKIRELCALEPYCVEYSDVLAKNFESDPPEKVKEFLADIIELQRNIVRVVTGSFFPEVFNGEYSAELVEKSEHHLITARRITEILQSEHLSEFREIEALKWRETNYIPLIDTTIDEVDNEKCTKFE